MRVIHLHHGRQYYYDSEFTSVNQNRVDNDITLEFYLANCDCGAQGLYLVEQANMRANYYESAAGLIPEPSYETIDIKCPADCGGSIRMAFSDIHPTHGLKIRCLEAWTRRVEVNGLDPKEQHHEPHQHRTQGIQIYHNNKDRSVEVDIHLHFRDTDICGTYHDELIVREVARKLANIPRSRNILI